MLRSCVRSRGRCRRRRSSSARAVVEVGAFPERVDEDRILGEVREHAELDLRVVGRDQDVARIGDEGAADLAAERRADRDVLQVRVAAAQPPGGGDRLVEAGVHAAGLRVHELRQGVDVGALQLHQLAPLENLPRQVVGQRQFLEHFDGGRRRARRAGPLQHRQLQLVEQDFRQLLRRVDVELAAGHLEDRRRSLRQLLVDSAATARRARSCRRGCRRARRR